MIIDQILTGMLIALLIIAAIDMYCVYARDLMMLQQNSYRNERYVRWFNQSGESTTLLRLFQAVALFCLLVRRIPQEITFTLAIIILIWQIVALAGKKYKKPLVWTQRAKRIFFTMAALTVLLVAIAWVFYSMWLAAVVIVGLMFVSPVILLTANWLLRPVEKRINRKFYVEAQEILSSMPQLKIIGITGSYGKTSTKHYLHRILSEQFSTTMTPGSFNTTLGVIRTVREHLRPYDEVFICEMGAKQPGDIKEICDLVHPSIGIVTAVGEQHLETFGNIENVQRTKFELVDALPADGLAVLNNDFKYITNRPVDNVKTARYAVSNPENADFKAVDIKYSSTGTSFAIEGPGLKEPLRLNTQLVGECNVSNLMAAVIVALQLEVPIEKIRFAVEQIEPVEHRLSMKRISGGLTIIDDAFNSNPAGSKMAVEVLGLMKDEGQRIIITPGMIELGEHQHQANEQFGRYIAANADVAIIVGNYNRDAILAGLAKGPIAKDKVYAVDSFAQAQTLLQRISKPGDIVLYENDLPDTFK